MKGRHIIGTFAVVSLLTMPRKVSKDAGEGEKTNALVASLILMVVIYFCFRKS